MLFYSLLFTILNLTIVLASDINHSQCGKSQKKIDMLDIFPNLNEKPGDWPWMAVLGFKKSSNGETSFMCGASLISNQWLITAAHCVQNTGSYSISSARFGGLGNDEDKNMIVDVPISEAIQHPNYTSVPILNDIALIRLKNPVNFTNYIQPICILSEPVHKTNEFYSNKKLYDVSWLRPKMGPRTIFQSLRKILIPLVDEGKCKQTYLNQRNALIDERVLCGDEMNDSRESCLQSSSGGSLSMMLNETFYLAGVLSYGSCSLIQYPAVYTRVAYYTEWIKSIANL